MEIQIFGSARASDGAFCFGPQNPGANAFALANQLPNNIYAIVAAGVLSAVLVPQIVRAGLHADGGQDFVNRLVTLGVVVFVVAAAIATLCAPLLVDLYSFDSDSGALAGGHRPRHGGPYAKASWRGCVGHRRRARGSGRPRGG